MMLAAPTPAVTGTGRVTRERWVAESVQYLPAGNFAADPADPARMLLRRRRQLAVAMLGALVFSSAIALSARASATDGKRRHPPGALRLPRASVRRISGVVCGEVHGRWTSGRMASSGYFLTDVSQAHKYASLARHARGRERQRDQSRARSYLRRVKQAQPLCIRGASGIGAYIGTSRNVYVSPQFFGQHLMFEWGLDPAVPVHAMRLWDSNTQWCRIDAGTTSNEYDFGQLDALLAQASTLNADVDFTFGDTPQWAAGGWYPQFASADQCSDNSSALAPADESYWTNFVTALVTHAQGRIHAYELWNEVDYPPYWSGGMAAIVRMSVDAAQIIHSIDPSALVLSPSITDSSEGYAFLHQYLSSLPPGTIDAIAVHSYTDGAWPEDTVPAEMKAVRAALPPEYARTPIWSTEGGWGLNSQFSSSPSDQRAFVARYDLQMLAQGVARSYWYAYENSQWGSLWDGTTLTPAGVATATLNAWLVGGTLRGCRTADNNLWACDLATSAGRRAQIVWVTKRVVRDYPTTGFRTVNTLDGGSSRTGRFPLTVKTEPVLLSS